MIFIVTAISHDGIQKVYGYTNNKTIAENKVNDLYKNEPNEHYDYVIDEINELK